MSVYEYNTYKDFLRAFIKQNRSKGIITQIAKVCGCDRTYMSQVLNGKAELTPDHIVQFCDHYSFNEAESSYLLLLLTRDRASALRTRKVLDARLKNLRSEALALTKKVLNSSRVPNEISEEMRTQYYSSWLYGAIHILTSIEEFQSPGAIANKLNVSSATVHQILKNLCDMNLVRFEGDRYAHTGNDIYLARHASQISNHHLGWRMRAVERAHVKDDIHYTIAFSISQEDVDKLRGEIVALIEKQRKLVGASGADVAFALCIDFFGI